MFTGLIEDVGRVISLTERGKAAILTVSTALPTHEIKTGDSVAINGICLTVTSVSGKTVTFDVSPETLSINPASALAKGSFVNLERALRLGDRMGGHIVTGHIDCRGELLQVEQQSGNYVLTFRLPDFFIRYVVSKGSIAINGISLTVNAVTADEFSVNIIPHTFLKTSLATIKPSELVNIETDILGKYIERMSHPFQQKRGLSLSTLAANGFL